MVALMLMTDEIPNNPIATITRIATFDGKKFAVLMLKARYKTIHWPSIILVVVTVRFGRLQKPAARLSLVVTGLMNIGGGYGPYMMLGCLFVLCAVMGLFISNTATAVLMAPIALAAAGANRWGRRPIRFAWRWRWLARYDAPVFNGLNRTLGLRGCARRLGVRVRCAAMAVLYCDDSDVRTRFSGAEGRDDAGNDMLIQSYFTHMSPCSSLGTCAASSLEHSHPISGTCENIAYSSGHLLAVTYSQRFPAAFLPVQTHCFLAESSSVFSGRRKAYRLILRLPVLLRSVHFHQ